MEADSVDRLEAIVAESEAVLVEERNSPDPVARRRVAEALRAKARALAKLGRYEERAAVWDEMIVRFAEEPSGDDPQFVARMLINKALDEHRSGQEHAAIGTLDAVIEQLQPGEEDADGRLLAARALSLKRDVLIGLQQLDAACALDGEIIAWFGEAVEPEVRGRVAFALAHRAHALLRGHRVEEALRDSDELIRRFRGEDDPVALGRIAKLLLSQGGSLLRVGSASAASVMVTAGIILAGVVGEGARFAGQRLRLDHAPGIGQLQRLGVSAPTTSMSRLRVTVDVTQQRQRAAQTLAISREIVDRFAFDEEPDHQQMVATASIQGALALIFLGHVLEGARRFDQLTDTGREAVAEAFRGQAAGLRAEHGVLQELGAVANLAHRARTLGQGDPRIARIAFEESMRPGAPESPHSRRARWIARLIGPGKS